MVNREELINRLIEQLQLLDTLWEYHPQNPNKCDVTKLYKETSDKVIYLQNLLNEHLHE